MNKQLQQDIKSDLQQAFHVFYSSLNQHLKTPVGDLVKPYIQDIEDCTSFSDDVDLLVKFTYVLPNEEVKHTQYLPIQLFIQNGITLPEDIQRFKCVVKVKIRKNKAVYETTDSNPFYESETFIIKENSKSTTNALMTDSVEQQTSKNLVVVHAEDLREFSNDRIRVGETVSVEL